jgi:uncharacterized protein (TIGR00730 family)
LSQHQQSAKELGTRLAQAGIALVYGGGNIGLMGLLADAALVEGGKVVGVIPQFLIDLEVAHHGLSELIKVQSMHERKSEMASRADAFVALPGGFGTLEEFFEVLTWLQLGLHQKPCILLNVENFFTPLLAFLNSAHQSGLISADSMRLVTVCNSIDELMSILGTVPTSNRFNEEQT